MEMEKEEKGGPKAPQIRNKMTLYEQLSVSSQKFNPRPGSSLSFPPHCDNGCTMGPSPSSSQDGRKSTLVCSEHQSMEQSMVLDTKSVSIKTSQNEQRRKKALSIKEQKKSAPILDAGENLAEPDLPKSIDLNEDLHMESEEQDQKPHGIDASVQNKCLNDNGCRNASSAKNESCSKTLLDNSCRRESTGNDHNQEKDNKASGERNEARDAPMVDSSSRREVHPDDIVESIGPKQFWKARSAILNQQRVFAIQVFELHRLIKVQKLIAASPNMLLQGNRCIRKPSKKVPLKSLAGNQCLTKSSQQVPSEIIKQQESLSKTQAVTTRQEDDLQKPKQNIEAPTSYSSCQDGLHREVNVQHPEASPSVACAQRPSSWCFRPPGNQWLVPVISPSEGLVYKPCAGPYLPNNGIMPPVYQGCAQLNTAYGIIATYQRPNISVPPGALPFSANYYPASYPIPVLNQATVASAAEQVSLMDGSRPTEQTEQSPCKKPNPKVVAYSGRLSKFQALKDGKAASNPCEKGQLVVQSAEGSVQPSRGSKNQTRTRTRVIKAVPQNAKSEPELATKIFQSIQEERQPLDT
ncbi:hypothetical protein IHE45_20G046900 [Dioscorea alata]|uniref:Uncharacterized protein n=3 Tax=Dioscorea alata TaxID=55571 RepID=A0ACB7TU33_DIOAL|nr:hypothetical protein IHE45_20G046900 [Dioscorea alata]KAH7651288.1 hypothetical protein IHE45_20G046900 [Dioscorea alata]KAH7651289.1 hypothetical protein IHE45_20G046900 [Dioscorea alata]